MIQMALAPHLEGGGTTSLSEEEAGCRANLMTKMLEVSAEEDSPRHLRLPVFNKSTINIIIFANKMASIVVQKRGVSVPIIRQKR